MSQLPVVSEREENLLHSTERSSLSYLIFLLFSDVCQHISTLPSTVVNSKIFCIPLRVQNQALNPLKQKRNITANIMHIMPPSEDYCSSECCFSLISCSVCFVIHRRVVVQLYLFICELVTWLTGYASCSHLLIDLFCSCF